MFVPVAAAVLASPSPITPDPAGADHVGNGQGQQFITGGCLSTPDCAQNVVPSCCAFILGGAPTGICSGVDVANVNGKGGCGFGDPGSGVSVSMPFPPPAAASASPAASTGGGAVTGGAAAAGGGRSAQCAVDPSLAGSQNVGKGTASQFITGQCLSKADCASTCCVAQGSGVALCKAQLVTQEAGGSCDFSCSASAAAGSSSSSAAAVSSASAPPAASSAAASSASGAPPVAAAGSAQCTVNASLSGSQNVGKGTASQFITGQCLSKADCASTCCVAQSSGVALCKAQLVTQQAGGSCDFSCAA